MTRIAFVIDHLEVGGAQRHLLELLPRLAERGYRPELWAAAAEPGSLTPLFEKVGVRVRSFGIRRTMLRPATLAAVARVAADLRRRRVPIVHGYLFEGNVLAAAVGRWGGLPVVLVSKRSLDRYGRLDRRLAAWATNRAADRVLVNAAAVGEIVATHERCPRERIDLIPNGVRLPEGRPSPSGRASQPDERGDGPLAGMVGRLGWKKGYEHAIAAFALLRARIPGLRVDIIGDGPLREEIESRVERLGLASCVRLLGQRSDVAERMAGFDCFVLSSVIEGMPNALLEAMALGLPVVTTAAGGSAEVVEDGRSGLVVPPGNASALAAAVARVLADPALASRLGEAAARRVRKRYSLEAMVGSFDRLYRRELARAGLEPPGLAPTARRAEPAERVAEIGPRA